jgi:hypothetical protein
LTNIILKNKKNKKKSMWENTAAIYSILKEKNYKAKFLTSSILKKSINIILKIKK